jgi:hypothetical protein
MPAREGAGTVCGPRRDHGARGGARRADVIFSSSARAWVVQRCGRTAQAVGAPGSSSRSSSAADPYKLARPSDRLVCAGAEDVQRALRDGRVPGGPRAGS